MNPKKANPKITIVEEPSVVYETSKVKFKGINRATFDFDEEVKNGYTPEEFKAEMHKRIKAYPWKE
nr:hypothetical protein [uncultured Flavobacterium sp.]